MTMTTAQPGQEQRKVTDAVEKVARAICLAEGVTPEAVNWRWREYVDAATAAMHAARPTTDLGEDGELVERMNRAWRHFYNTVENPPENLVRKLIHAVLSRSGG